jgi:hypothetical protein
MYHLGTDRVRWSVAAAGRRRACADAANSWVIRGDSRDCHRLGAAHSRWLSGWRHGRDRQRRDERAVRPLPAALLRFIAPTNGIPACFRVRDPRLERPP